MVNSFTYSNTNLISNYCFSFDNASFFRGVSSRKRGFNDYIFSFSNTQRSEHSIIRNQKKLGVIERLSDDWNGNGANSFSKELVDKVRLLLDEILHQPEIFPTAGDSIQLEYDRNNGQHLEFEISENNDIEVYEELLDGKTEEYSIPFDVNSINEVLRRFYDE